MPQRKTRTQIGRRGIDRLNARRQVDDAGNTPGASVGRVDPSRVILNITPGLLELGMLEGIHKDADPSYLSVRANRFLVREVDALQTLLCAVQYRMTLHFPLAKASWSNRRGGHGTRKEA
jgi:hypothetical protein